MQPTEKNTHWIGRLRNRLEKTGDSEPEQALLRLAIAALLVLYFCIPWEPDEYFVYGDAVRVIQFIHDATGESHQRLLRRHRRLVRLCLFLRLRRRNRYSRNTAGDLPDASIECRRDEGARSALMGASCLVRRKWRLGRPSGGGLGALHQDNCCFHDREFDANAPIVSADPVHR